MPLRVNMADGSTALFDLTEGDQVGAWERSQSTPQFQSSIRGLIISHDGGMFALPTPRKFGRIAWGAELILDRKDQEKPIGERVFVHADDVVASLSVIWGSGSGRSSTRLDLKRTGKQRFDPHSVRR